MINLLTYSKKYSNKQNLIFTIENKISNEFYDIKFEKDNYILQNVDIKQILNGIVKNPKSEIKLNLKIKHFYHDIYHTAIQYETKIDFLKNHRNLYRVAEKNKWLNEICEHTVCKRLKWTYEKCKEKALLCKTKVEFSEKYKSAHESAYHNGWLKEILSHTKNANIIWTYSKCLEKSLLCNSRKEFSEKYNKAYSAAWRNNWLNTLCEHMTEFVNPLIYPRIIYAYIFEETKTIYIGLSKNFKIRHSDRICKNNDSIMNYIKETNLKPVIKMLTDYIPANLAQIKEQEFIDEYKTKNWNVLNKAKGGGLGGNYQKIEFLQL